MAPQKDFYCNKELDGENSEEWRSLDLVTFVHEFYVLEDIMVRTEARLREGVVFVKPLERLLQDIVERQNYLVEQGTRTLYDYLCIAALGEARYAPKVARSYFVEINGRVTNDTLKQEFPTREVVYESGKDYDPKSFLPQLDVLFNKVHWAKSSKGHNVECGGPKWGHIVRMAMKYWTYPKKIWLDSVVSLSHNGTIAFNKDILVSVNSYLYLLLLDDKFRGQLSTSVRNYSLTFTAISLIHRAANLKVLKSFDYPRFQRCTPGSLYKYLWHTPDHIFPRIKWRAKKLKYMEDSPKAEWHTHSWRNYIIPGCSCEFCMPKSLQSIVKEELKECQESLTVTMKKTEKLLDSSLAATA